jgi:GTP-binding protein Era
VNKVDLVSPREKLLPYIAELHGRGYNDLVPVSARGGKNCDLLEQEVLVRMPESELIFPVDQLSDRSERFFAAEFLREQIIRRYHKELPYAVTVDIERFEQSEPGLRIGAVIWVERDSQKGIVVGRGGNSLKAAATAARKEMAEFYDMPVHLDVWVRVKKSWSSDERSLIQLGYSE